MKANEVIFRIAVEDDLDSIVQMISDDDLGATRERYEQPLPACYHHAFQAIQTDPNNELVVACLEKRVVGVLQITFILILHTKGDGERR